MEESSSRLMTHRPMALGVNISIVCWRALKHKQKRDNHCLVIQQTTQKQNPWFIQSHSAIEISQRNRRPKVICSRFCLCANALQHTMEILTPRICVILVDPVVHLDTASFETIFENCGFLPHQIDSE